jgi:hypothetical protein
LNVSLYLGPGDRHVVRFDELVLDEVATLMRVISSRQKVQVSDYHRNILGIWNAGLLRDAAAELSRISVNEKRPLSGDY